jgi:hypothetical protein
MEVVHKLGLELRFDNLVENEKFNNLPRARMSFSTSSSLCWSSPEF